MPGINLTVSGQADAALTKRLVTTVMELTGSLLDKEAERTLMMVRYHPHADWFIAGQSLLELGQNSFRLEVTITDETNTKQQKAAFQKAAYAALAELIGNVHAHSNIHLLDVRATAYSYGGITLEQYFQDAQR
ncbi:tautomerase family protein [Pseudomonas sp. 2835]|uniref:tautomerase family protein n=1 Tax=Pseudomonas sp. 2835 TaxID=3156451 RepID=UPI003D242B04